MIRKKKKKKKEERERGPSCARCGNHHLARWTGIEGNSSNRDAVEPKLMTAYSVGVQRYERDWLVSSLTPMREKQR